MNWNNKTGLTYCRVPSTCHPYEGYGCVWEEYMVCSPTKASETDWTRPLPSRIGKIVLRGSGTLVCRPPNLAPDLRSLTFLLDVLVQSRSPRVVSVSVLSKHRRFFVIPPAPHPMAPPPSLVKFYWQPNRTNCSLQLLLPRSNRSEGQVSTSPHHHYCCCEYIHCSR
jgi:hypothetical protein